MKVLMLVLGLFFLAHLEVTEAGCNYSCRLHKPNVYNITQEECEFFCASLAYPYDDEACNYQKKFTEGRYGKCSRDSLQRFGAMLFNNFVGLVGVLRD